MAQHGVFYPMPRDSRNAMAFRPNSGNYRTPGIRHMLGRLLADGHDNVLFSSEYLYQEILQAPDLLAFLRDTADVVRVLLYIRDPLEHLASTYQQSVKRKGYYDTMDVWTKGQNFKTRWLVKTVDFVTLCRDAGANLHVLNYSQRKDVIARDVEAWLSLPADTLEAPHKTVNRSLTFSEAELIRFMNHHSGQAAGSRLANHLVDSFPDIVGERILPTRPVLTRFVEKIALSTAAFDRLYDGGAGARFDFDAKAVLARLPPEDGPCQTPLSVLQTLPPLKRGPEKPSLRGRNLVAELKHRARRRMRRVLRVG